MRQKEIEITPDALDRNAICLAQSAAGAGNLTIAGVKASSGVATLDIPRHVAIYSAADDSSATFTVYGTNRYGASISEAITGATAGATVYGAKNFATVTRVAISKASAGNVEVGTYTSFDMAVIPVNYRGGSVSYEMRLSSGASLTHNVKYTLDDVFNTQEDSIVFYTDLGDKTASTTNGTSLPITGIRAEITGYTSGTITFRVLQHAAS